MQHIQPLLQEGGEIADELVRIDLGGFGLRALGHGIIEPFEGDGFPQVIRIGLAIQIKMKTDVRDVPGPEMPLRQVGGGAAAKLKSDTDVPRFPMQ